MQRSIEDLLRGHRNSEVIERFTAGAPDDISGGEPQTNQELLGNRSKVELEEVSKKMKPTNAVAKASTTTEAEDKERNSWEWAGPKQENVQAKDVSEWSGRHDKYQAKERETVCKVEDFEEEW